MRKWDPVEDCDGGDWPTGEKCIGCKAAGICDQAHVEDLEELDFGTVMCQLCGKKVSQIDADVGAPDHPYCCEKHGFIQLCPDCWLNHKFWDTDNPECLVKRYSDEF
jgi:hypothetical protein